MVNEVKRTEAAETATAQASLIRNIIAAAVMFLGIFDRLGGALALGVIGVALVVIAGGQLLVLRFHELFSRFAPTSSVRAAANSTLIVGVLGIVVGFLAWFCGFASARLFRSDFTKSHVDIAITAQDYAGEHFAPSAGVPQSQKEKGRAELNQWILWMSRGASDDDRSSSEQEKRHAKLLYIEGHAFDASYDTITAVVDVSPALEVEAVAAFLMQDVDDKPWYQPIWRQLSADVNGAHDSVEMTVKTPDAGDRLAIFLKVTDRKGSKKPPKDQLVIGGRIRIRP